MFTRYALKPSTVNASSDRERGSVRVELLGGVATEELCGGRVLAGHVRHDVAVPPAGARARLLPALGRRVLDRPAQPLSLRVGDADQLFPGEAHVGGGSFLRGGGPACRAGRVRRGIVASAGCASSWPPTSSAARSRRVRPRRRWRPDGDGPARRTGWTWRRWPTAARGRWPRSWMRCRARSCAPRCRARARTRSRPRSGSPRRPRDASRSWRWRPRRASSFSRLPGATRD